MRKKDFPLGCYGVIVVIRNGAKTIGSTLNSIMDQTLPPTILCVVDDGSTDDTPQLLKKFSKKFPKRVCLIALPNRGYDIRRVMRNINQGIREVRRRGITTKYMMISGDDCVYPRDYAEYIVGKMEKNPELVVASGDFEDAMAPSLAPQGSGRFVEDGFLKSLGDGFPPFYGSESWILEKALQHGYRVRCFHEVRYRHLRKLGSKHRFRDWGVGHGLFGIPSVVGVISVFQRHPQSSTATQITGHALALLPSNPSQKRLLLHFIREGSEAIRL